MLPVLHDQKYRHISFRSVIFRLGQPKISQCIPAIRNERLLTAESNSRFFQVHLHCSSGSAPPPKPNHNYDLTIQSREVELDHEHHLHQLQKLNISQRQAFTRFIWKARKLTILAPSCIICYCLRFSQSLQQRWCVQSQYDPQSEWSY